MTTPAPFYDRLVKMPHPYSFQLALWLSLALALLHTCLVLIDNAFPENWPALSLIILWLSSSWLLYLMLFSINFRIIKRSWSQQRLVASHVFYTLGLAVLYTTLYQWVSMQFFGKPLQLNLVFRDILGALTVICVMIVLNIISHHQQTVLENEQLQAENLQVRLNSLTNQVDPHFLFNSLNTLDGLIGLNDDHAHTYVRQLASTYRYIMRQQHIVPLSEELEFARNYIYLMQIRYSQNLQVQWDIDPAMEHLKVVPISLQLLVENAIKHNVVSARHPLTIHIATTPEGALRVSNQRCHKEDEEGGSGLGLANLNNRYQLVAHQDIAIHSSDDLFVVTIPLLP